jgi:chromosome partitioning protein
VSDADNFRTRATEIFRQLRNNGEPADTEGPSETGQEPAALGPDGAEPTHPGTPDAAIDPPRLDPSNRQPASGGPISDSTEHALLRANDTIEPTVAAEPPPSSDGEHDELHPIPDLGDIAEPSSVHPGGHSSASPGVSHLVLPPDDSPRFDPLAGLGMESDEQVAPGDRRHPGSEHPLPRILAIANQKGGVGKTTTAVNLGASLAELGYRVLVTDLDPQGNATTGLGINGRNLDASIYDVLLHETPLEDVIEPTTLRNLFVVPATIDLAGAEIELVPVFSRELRLRRALDTVRDDFDFILIDCPPSLGLLTVNGLAAATEVVVPIQCEYYALEGLGQLLRNVNLVQGNLNNVLELSTIILTMYDARTRLAEQVVNDVRKHFGARVCRSVVPRTVRLSEAPSFGQPIIVFDSSSRGAIAYRELAKEVSGGAPQRVR